MILRIKLQEMVQVMHECASLREQEQSEIDSFAATLVRENDSLRELLGIGKLELAPTSAPSSSAMASPPPNQTPASSSNSNSNNKDQARKSD